MSFILKYLDKLLYNHASDDEPDHDELNRYCIEAIQLLGGNKDVINRIVKKIIDENWCLQSLLHHEPNLELASALIEYNMFDINYVSGDRGDSILMRLIDLSVDNPYAENLTLKLIDKIKDSPVIDMPNDYYETPLFLACERGLPTIAIKLLRTGKVDPYYDPPNAEFNKNPIRAALDVPNHFVVDMSGFLNEVKAFPALNVASAVRLRTTEKDKHKPETERKGYRDADISAEYPKGILNPSAPKDIEKKIRSYLGGKTKRKGLKNNRTKCK